jgi:hypothetical protein
MYQHRGIEISVREHPYDMVQVGPDILDACFILWILCRHNYFAAIFEQVEMMRSCVMGKAHHMVTALNHACPSTEC